MTLVLRFGGGDAARCRFAISPLQETMMALLVLKSPGRRGWATDPGIVAAELAEHARRLDPRTVPADLYGVLTGDPVIARDALAAQQQLAWQVLIAPLWDRIQGLLDADIASRSRQLAEGGLEGLFANLHPRSKWQNDELHLTGFRHGTVDLRGRGLILAPAAFGWPNLGIGPTDSTSATSPVLVYPMIGAGRLWETGSPPPVLQRLLGTGRAAVLTETGIPSTTSGLARRLGLAQATVSEHLAILRDAGLVTSRRHGREVLYRQTPLAGTLMGHATSFKTEGEGEGEGEDPGG